MTKILFLGSINNGILMQTKNAGALNTLSSKNETDKLVESTRTIATEIKSNIRKKTACTVFLLTITINADPTVIIEKK